MQSIKFLILRREATNASTLIKQLTISVKFTLTKHSCRTKHKTSGLRADHQEQERDDPVD